MIRLSILALAALAGCSKPTSDPPRIVPEPSSSSATSSGVAGAGGDGATSGAGSGGAAGHGGDVPAATSGAGAPGDGGGSSSASGTRLMVSSYVGDDGSTFIRPEAYDSVLGFHCSFHKAIDGTTRCFPLTWAAGLSFVDAACSVALLNVPECDDDSPRFATLYERAQDAACSVKSNRAFRLGETLAGADYIYLISAGECVRVNNLNSSLFYAEEIPVSDLALASKRVDGT